MHYICGKSRDQVTLFPDTIEDYIEEDNQVRFMDVFIDGLDMVGLGFKYSELNDTGRPPYDPRDLLKLYLYGYLNRIRSSRRLEKETHRNIELMWLIGKLKPDFKTIADFRKNNKKAIREVNKEFILLCKKLDLFGCELVSTDGSKFKASNSKKRNFTNRKLRKRIKEIEDKIEEYLEELDRNDKKESHVNNPDKDELKEKIDSFKKRKKAYNQMLKRLKDSGESQISITDTDSREMKSKQGTDVCYNVQFTVDSKHSLVIDYDVTNEETDRHQLSKMGKRAKEILGVEEIEILADKGYHNEDEIKDCVDNGITPYVPEQRRGISKKEGIPLPKYTKDKFKYEKDKDIYICPEGEELNYRFTITKKGKKLRLYKSKECLNCQKRELCTKKTKGRIIYRWEHENIIEDVRERIKHNKEKVKLRNSMIEHVFGTVKRNFNHGYFLLKGKEKVNTEMSLTVLAYNITRVINIIGLKKLMEAA